MNPRIKEMVERMRQIEEELELELQRRRQELQPDFGRRKVFFAREVREQQQRFKTGLWAYVSRAEWRHVLSVPFVYGVLPALLLLDATVSLYQLVCFPLYRIARVPRADYFAYDRGHLAYLNLLEKINCVYCSYGNGVLTYAVEVVARTEQYWCPIKHARRMRQVHGRYSGFVDYGNAQAFRDELRGLREELTRLDSKEEE